MKQIIFMFCLYMTMIVVLTISYDVVEGIAHYFAMSKTDIENCMNKTDVQIENLMRINQLVDDNIHKTDIDTSALKVSCFGACLMQKKEVMLGTFINKEKLKKFLRDSYAIVADENDIIWNVVDRCVDRVKSMTDECEVTLRFSLCLRAEGRQTITNNTQI